MKHYCNPKLLRVAWLYIHILSCQEQLKTLRAIRLLKFFSFNFMNISSMPLHENLLIFLCSSIVKNVSDGCKLSWKMYLWSFFFRIRDFLFFLWIWIIESDSIIMSSWYWYGITGNSFILLQQNYKTSFKYFWIVS